MRKILFGLICTLVVTGCFFGGAGDSAITEVKKDTVVNLPKTKSLVPGLYVGDYTWIDSNKMGLESELNLQSTGEYQLSLIQVNEAVYNQKGTWALHDSSMHFENAEAAGGNGGFFYKYSKIENDTNSIRNITDTSFIRLEYTPLRQKPYWITYRKRSYPKLSFGYYQHIKSYQKDSVTTIDVKFNINLEGGVYKFSIVEDTLESFQIQASWRQIGTFLVTEKNLQREYVDSSKSFSAWDTLGGVIMQRLRTVSDSSFQMWNPPGNPFDTGSWDKYKAKK